jgi:hypothetical protein
METEYYYDEDIPGEVGEKELSTYSEEDILSHRTDTSKYDETKFDVISPEEVMDEEAKENNDNPNPEFTKAITDLEKSIDRQLTQEEFLKVAETYATILVERDEEDSTRYKGEYEINPVKKELYLKMILEKEPVEKAFQKSMKSYEDQMLLPLVMEIEEAQKNELKVIEMKSNNRVNVRYKGKCRIAADEGGKVIVIDNKNDVDLLHMKYRKEWIDKKYPEAANPAMMRIEDDDEFV